MEFDGGSYSESSDGAGNRIKTSEELLAEAGIKFPNSLQELYPVSHPYTPYFTPTRELIPQYSSNLEEFENEPYKDYKPINCHSADFPDPDNLSDYDDDNIVVPEGIDPVYYKKTRRDSVALDRYLAIIRRKLDEAGPEDPSEKDLYSAGQQYYEKAPPQGPNMYSSGYPGYGSYQQAHQGAGYGCTSPPQVPNMYSSGYPGYGSYQQAHQGQGNDGYEHGARYGAPPQGPNMYSGDGSY